MVRFVTPLSLKLDMLFIIIYSVVCFYVQYPMANMNASNLLSIYMPEVTTYARRVFSK